MRTFSLLSLVLLTSCMTFGCSFESDTPPPLTLGQMHTPDTLATMIQSRDLSGIQDALAAGVDPNLPGSSNLPPLHLTATLGFIEEGRLLLENGAEVDKICVVPVPGDDDEQVWQPMTSPLHLAVQEAHVDFVLMLLDHQVDVNVQNAREATPLDMAKVVADQLQRRAERLSESLEEERDLKHGRAEPLREMLEQTQEQLQQVESVARLLEHHGAKTRPDLQAARLLAEIDADGTLHNVAGRVRQWKQGHKVLGRDVASRDETPQDALRPSSKKRSSSAPDDNP